MKKRTVSTILTLAILLSALVSCSEKSSESENGADQSNDQPSTTVQPEEEPATEEPVEEERIKPDIPESGDFGGDDIKFLFWRVNGWESTVRDCRDIYAAELTGEAINDTVYNRNLKVEDAYNVKISLEIQPVGDLSNTVLQEVTSGGTTYDVIYPRLYEAPSLYQKGYFQNLLKVPNIDFTKPWWDQNSIDAVQCMGYLPCVATSINVNDKDATAAMAFNKGIVVDNGLVDIYELVRNGEWTFDKLSELSEAVYRDTNGDGTMTPDDDLFGFLGADDVMWSFFAGSGSLFTTRDENGAFIFSYGSERDIDVTTATIKLMNQPWFMNHHKISNTDDIYYRQLFETGHGLFFWMRLDEVTNMRAGEADFGIIPTPKYDEAQEKYYSMVSQHTTGLLSIPITVSGEALDEVGLILEALAAESHYTLIPEYIETSLKTKNSRDAESADMLDIIISNRVFDPMNIYNFSSFTGSYAGLANSSNADVASFIARQTKTVTKMHEKTTEALAKAAAGAQ